MKKLLLVTLLCCSFVAVITAQTAKKIWTDPLYPQANGPVKILLNVKNYPDIDTTVIDIWTAVTTSVGAWQHNPISDWNQHPDSLKMKRENDSIYSFSVSNISQYYKVPAGEEIVSINFIARGGGKQTEDFQLEVFNGQPTDAFKLFPTKAYADKLVVVTFNINQDGKNLKDTLANNPQMPIYIHTGVNTNLGDWQHGTDWGTVGNNDKLKLMQVSDSIFRFYVTPNTFYNVTNPAEAIKTLNFVVRSKDGSRQTNDIIVPIEFTAPTIISQVKSSLIYPTYPKVSDKIFIYVNASKYGFNLASDLSAWTGLITSESKNVGDDWKNNPIKDWFDLSVKLTRLNDSIHVFEIPSIKDLYKVDTKTIDVFRIAFIARDSANGTVSKQTENIYFEIYGSEPKNIFSTQPAKLKENKAAVITFNISTDSKTLGAYLADTTDKEVFAYTGVNKNWDHQPAEWGKVGETAKLKCITVNDSIIRFYMLPNAITFYGITDTCEHIYTANIVLRNKAGNAQANDIIVAFDTTSYVPCEETNIAVTKAENKFSVSPNPMGEVITVSSEAAIKEISISNLMGQRVLFTGNLNQNSETISVNGLNKGMYIISVKTINNNSSSLKVIKR